MSPNNSLERTPPAPRLVIPFAISSHSFVARQGHFGYHGVCRSAAGKRAALARCSSAPLNSGVGQPQDALFTFVAR